jgi:CubicO group peptidase (beta-lactamase class C family)
MMSGSCSLNPIFTLQYKCKYLKQIIIGYYFLFISIAGWCQDRAAVIDKMMQDAANGGFFNGVIAVVEDNKPIYCKGFGYADAEKKISNDANTLFNLCSISKQFTAMAVMMLKEENKLGIDDELVKYFPELPYSGITIRQMLSHISGLPDYMVLAMKQWPENNNYSNREAIELLAKNKPPVLFEAGEKFQYCNTGYMLLASIVEKLSGQTFSRFLKERIFDPLQMSRTFVCTRDENEAGKQNCANGYVFERTTLSNIKAENSEQFSRQVRTIVYPVGDGGVFSTANDMMKWDAALKTGKLVKATTLQEAFISAKTNDGRGAGYGFGWFVAVDSANGKIVQHTGGWPGFRNAFIRYLDKNRTLLVLRNNEIEFRGIQPAIINILDNKAFHLPEPSLAQAFAFASLNAGPSSIQKTYTTLKGHCIVNENEINDVGYGLLQKGLPKHALEVMKINVELFPGSANAFDSLGELYLKNDNKELAAENYKRSLAIDPNNDAARKVLEKL